MLKFNAGHQFWHCDETHTLRKTSNIPIVFCICNLERTSLLKKSYQSQIQVHLTVGLRGGLLSIMTLFSFESTIHLLKIGLHSSPFTRCHLLRYSCTHGSHPRASLWYIYWNFYVSFISSTLSINPQKWMVELQFFAGKHSNLDDWSTLHHICFIPHKP